ncbi:efflux RND transporter periplasmic adaptor subunit [Moritella marina]|uniref:efflux RND transporter periplasmic adaptor subunit n=1 Tax=Moritella marina TaxID=90736 RepID=UPI0037037933
MSKLTLLFTAIFLLSGCSKAPETATVELPKAVKFQRVSESTGSIYREISGQIRSAEQSSLSFRVNGVLQAIYVSKGDLVVTGQPLAQLDDSDFTVALNKTQASLGSSRASAKAANDQLQRATRLPEGVISLAELEQLGNNAEAALQQVKVIEADLARAKLELQRTILRSPFDGQIAAVSVDNFSKVSNGQEVIELIDGDAYEVEVLLPESMIGNIDYQQAVSVTVSALQDKMFAGEVSEIGSRVENGNAFPVTIRLNKSSDKLRNGMSGSVKFTVNNSRVAAYLVPLTALDFTHSMAGEGSQDALLYVINEQTMVLEQRNVKVGHIRANNIEVYTGINENEAIVVAGIPFLRDGMAVTLWQVK